MKKTLQVIAVVLALGIVASWVALGANRGWTKTSREVRQLDEVTGIEGITNVSAFVPGVDFLGAGLLAAVALAGASLFFRKPKQTTA
jgi:hypothetical protein